MDGGPRRSQSRSVINRSDSVSDSSSKQPEATPPPTTTPPPRTKVTPARSYSPHKKEPTPGFFKNYWMALVILMVIIVAATGAFFYYKSNSTTAIDSDKYQAVFITNGQVYFGKLNPLNGDYMRLTDVYYLQSEDSTEASGSENPQNSSSDESSMQLVKLGQEIHGPEDEMIISKDQLMFYENLKTDGEVSNTIETYKLAQ